MAALMGGRSSTDESGKIIPCGPALIRARRTSPWVRRGRM